MIQTWVRLPHQSRDDGDTLALSRYRLFSSQCMGESERYRLQGDHVAGSALGQPRKIRFDDVSDRRITPDGLAIGTEHDRLTIWWDLDGSGNNPLRDSGAGVDHRQRGTLQSQAGTINGGAHLPNRPFDGVDQIPCRAAVGNESQSR